MSEIRYPNPTHDASTITSDERTWAVIGHLSTLVAAVLSAGWLSLAGPLAVWAVGREKSPFVRQSAARAFNFNLVIWALTLAGWVCAITLIGIPIAILLWSIAVVAGLWFHIRAAMAAGRGELYRYPWGITVLR
ncbi:MAG: DUF4870 domain-containing protein [Micrococcales bacterium]|nr:DUF4870 domain-containing protein [Micrococcales bacterium]